MCFWQSKLLTNAYFIPDTDENEILIFLNQQKICETNDVHKLNQDELSSGSFWILTSFNVL